MTALPSLPRSKGGRKPGQKNKSTALAKEAVARFVDGNSWRFEKWLDKIEERDGPRAAFQCLESLLEYHVPKLSRRELTGLEDGPVELKITWSEEAK